MRHALLLVLVACSKKEAPPVETQPVIVASSAPVVASSAPVVAAAPSSSTLTIPMEITVDGGSGKPIDPLAAKRKAELQLQADEMQLQMLKALGSSNGSSTENVLRKSDMPTDLLDNAAVAGSGSGKSNGADLNLGGGGAVRAGSRSLGTLSDIADNTRDH